MAQRPARGQMPNPVPVGGSWWSEDSRVARCDFFWHAHACAELIVIGDCGLKVRIGDHDGHIDAPGAVLLGPGVPHAFYSDGFLPDGQSADLRMLWFDPAALEGLRGLAPEFAAIDGVLAGSRRGLSFRPAATARVMERMAGVRHLTGMRGLALVLDVLAILAADGGTALCQQPADGAIDHDLERLRLVEGWLRARFREPITLPQAAAACGIGVTTLNELLKRHYRQTFLEFVSDLRLQRTKEDLTRSDRPVTDIAFANGFGSIATFNRRFRQVEGVGPQEWRERNRSG